MAVAAKPRKRPPVRGGGPRWKSSQGVMRTALTPHRHMQDERRRALCPARHGSASGRCRYRRSSGCRPRRCATPHWYARQRCHSKLIARAELEAFADQYLSLGALAAEARIQANHVARRMERNGIIPLDFPAHLNKIFQREAVQPPEHVGRPPIVV